MLFNFLNFIFFKLQYAYMKPDMTREKVDLNAAWFHPRDTKKMVFKNWRRSINNLKNNKIKKILITGVFDVLHNEHINFLQKAASLGELVIGLESDYRVKKLKGPNRPINKQNIRLKNLQRLNLADQVFILPEQFDQPQDHLKLLKKIRPDILAVSSHSLHIDKKKKLMQQIGGELKIIHQHNPKISSSQLLAQKK